MDQLSVYNIITQHLLCLTCYQTGKCPHKIRTQGKYLNVTSFKALGSKKVTILKNVIKLKYTLYATTKQKATGHSISIIFIRHCQIPAAHNRKTGISGLSHWVRASLAPAQGAHRAPRLFCTKAEGFTGWHLVGGQIRKLELYCDFCKKCRINFKLILRRKQL